MSAENVAELAGFISESFPTDLPPQEVIGHLCDECLSLKNDFIGRTWTEISEDTVVRNFDNLPLFTPEAFAFYVPAFMTYALSAASTKEEKVLEFLIYSLSPSGDDSEAWWKLRKERLNTAQRKAICNFLRFVGFEDKCFESDVANGLKFFDCANL